MELIIIQPLESIHVSTVAEIHIASQPGTFLTSLGQDFLISLYHQISESKYSLSYVALNGNTLIGFVVGTVDTKRLFKEIALKAPFPLGWLIVKRAASRPAILWQAGKTLSYPSHGAKKLPNAELLALAIDGDWRNQKIGSQLIQKLVQNMKEASISQIVVTVDGSNDGAFRFYQRHGFVLQSTVEMYGRPMNHLILTLDGTTE